MKVLLVATVQSHICQFHKPLVEILHTFGAEVHVAARDNLVEKNGLKLDFAEKVYDVHFARSPKSPDNIKAYRQLKKIIDSGDYDLIHCNTPMGGLVTRLAAKDARKKGTKVIYMAHGFHFFKGASKKNWLLFYPIERMMAKECDVIITINDEDYALAKAKFSAQIEHIHGVGVSTERYHTVSKEEFNTLRDAERLSKGDFVVLCTGELNRNKDQKTLIFAAALLKEQIPNLKILLAGNGPLENELRDHICSLGLENNVKMLGYRTDLEKIVPIVNAVVSCSHREGMPLNVIEAMLCKKPVIATFNRGHNELVADNKTGYLFPPGDIKRLAECIMTLYKSEDVIRSMGENGYLKAIDYSVPMVQKEIYNLINRIQSSVSRGL